MNKSHSFEEALKAVKKGKNIQRKSSCLPPFGQQVLGKDAFILWTHILANDWIITDCKNAEEGE